MNIPELEQKIRTLEGERDRLRTQMDLLVTVILSETTAFLQHFLEEEMHNTIQRFPNKIKALNPDTLKKIKQELAELRDQLPHVVTGRLKADANWMHRQNLQISIENLQTSIEVYERNKQTDMYDKNLRLLMGIVGSVLWKYKLTDYSHWENHSSGSFRWAIGYTRTTELDKALAEYSSALSQYISLVANLNETEREKERAEAKDLWDRV